MQKRNRTKRGPAIKKIGNSHEAEKNERAAPRVFREREEVIILIITGTPQQNTKPPFGYKQREDTLKNTIIDILLNNNNLLK